MLIMRKFLFGCVGLGILSYLGAMLVQTPAVDSATRALGSSSVAGNSLIQCASVQVESVYHEASSQLVPNLKSLSASSSALARSSATTARLQFEGMANSLPGIFAVNTWLPRSAPSWTQNGVAAAVQVSGSQAITLSKNMPSVKAVKTSIERLANAHP